MALYGVRLVINLFDLCIYRRYLEEFIGNRKTSMEFSVLLLIVCELIGSAVNQMGISWLNFVTMVAILSLCICLPVRGRDCKQADCGFAVYGDYGY